MNILITGGAGFVGSNLAVSLKLRFPEYNIICLDNLKRRGSEFILKRLIKYNVEFKHGDVRNKEDLELGNIDLLIDCSAEPSVMSGFGSSPEYLINTNLMGSINCFELARKYSAKIIFISTSRVYPYDVMSGLDYGRNDNRFLLRDNYNIPGISGDGISEDFGLIGSRSLYGATKLSAELLLHEYYKTYGLGYVINRCGVIAGPWQMGKVDQGIFTYWMASHVFKRDLKYIGFGGEGIQVRDLLHIDDFCNLIALQIENFDLVSGGTYNVGGGKNNLSLLETTRICEDITGNKVNIHSEKDTRFADVPVYITNNDKINKILGWLPVKTPREILEDIYFWIINNRSSLEGVL